MSPEPGVTMVEVMKPSDWGIIPKISYGGIRLNKKQRFTEPPPETAMSMFDFTSADQETMRRQCTPVSKVSENNQNGSLVSISSSEECSLSFAQKLGFNRKLDFHPPERIFLIGVMMSGKVAIGDVALAVRRKLSSALLHRFRRTCWHRRSHFHSSMTKKLFLVKKHNKLLETVNETD